MIPRLLLRLPIEDDGLALIDTARQTFTGTLLAMTDPSNEPSMRAITKRGFDYWKQGLVDGHLDNLYRLQLH